MGDDRIVGYGGLDKIDAARGQAELRFWVGCGVNRNSDAAEWPAAIVEFGLPGLNMNQVYPFQFERHPVADRVLADTGMHQEGLVRKQIFKGRLVEDSLQGNPQE